MIQRAQSVYLFLASVIMVPLFFIPFVQFFGDSYEYVIDLWGITALPHQKLATSPFMGILAIVATLLPLVTIFLFRNRTLQLKLCLAQMILLVGLQMYMGICIFGAQNAIAQFNIGSIQYSIVDLFPILSLLFIFLAFRGINKDIDLLKSLDRIR